MISHLLRVLLLSLWVSSLSGCVWRLDPMNVLLRSDVIKSAEDEQRILAKASVSWTEDGRVQVLHVSGSPYERGYQHGALLRTQVRDNLLTLYSNVLEVYRSEELFAEAYERLRPHIPPSFVEEMRGLAHGSKLPLKVIHHIHALPSLTEWGGKRKLKKIVKKMIRGQDLGTSCSNFSLAPSRTESETLYTVRVLDWGLHRISNLHEHALFAVSTLENGRSFVTVSWAGFLGAVSGMNDQGITLGEMGYKDPEYETLHGMPMVVLLRQVLEKATSTQDAVRIVKEATPTNSFVYLFSDGKTNESVLMVRDPQRTELFYPGEPIVDPLHDQNVRPIADTLYAGHYNDRMNQQLASEHSRISLEQLQSSIIPEVVMKSNFHNVIYEPEHLKIWVAHAAGPKLPAAEQPYTFFNLQTHLASQR